MDNRTAPTRSRSLASDAKIVIRPSSLVSWADCPRRAASSSYRDLFLGFGYEVRERQVSAGAAVGTAVHAGAAYTLQAKVDTGEPGNAGEAEERAMASFRHEIEHGANWDDTTPRPNDGEKQLLRMVAEYRRSVAPRISPVAVEQRLTADLGDGFSLSGQADNLALLPDAIRDLKTGIERIHMPQTGAYSLLARSNGREVNALFEDFIPRVRVSYAQPPSKEIAYPVEIAEQVALRRITTIKRDLTEFIATGDVMAFDANPSSQLCGLKYCPIFGTATCREHRGAFKGTE